MTANIFLQQLEQKPQSQGSQQGNIFLKQLENMPPKGEGFGKSAARTLLQPLMGIAKRWTYHLDLAKAATAGAQQNILSELAENEPELKGGRAEERASELLHKYFPTQERGEELLEEKTGAPLRPKTKTQKMLRLGSEAASFRPGGVAAKGTAGITAPAVSEGLQIAGAPEELADLAGLFASGVVPEATVSKVTKPSGMVARQFEKLEKPTKVSPARHQAVTQAIEKDVRNISEDLLKKHPDYQAIRNDPNYREALEAGFEKVSEKAGELPGRFQPKHINSFLTRRLNNFNRERKGISATESEESFRKEFDNILRKVAEGKQGYSVKDLVDQFRKNNSELAGYFEPGKSKAFNTGKRDALLEYNRGIEEFFEQVYPESEFSKVFKEQNKKWSQLQDVDFIEGKLDSIFKDGKINFNEAAKILNKTKVNARRPFQRMMGKEGFEKFETLLKDLQSVRNPYALLKKAEMGGWGALAKLAGSYLMHPSLAKTYAAIQMGKEAMRVLLDKPQLSLKWKSALDNLKAGKYAESEREFKDLDAEVKSLAERVTPSQRKMKTLPEGFANSIL